MNILIIGQTSLHWGRMEFGNIGNYYVMEPFFEEIRNIFPTANIKTTIQMSDEFCINYNLKCIPLDLYYSWDDDQYLNKTFTELGIAHIYNKTGYLHNGTPYINEVSNSDLIIDMSGDVWGDNADFAGKNRFLIGLIKDQIAQLLKKQTVMLASSPGPFVNNSYLLEYAKEVFSNFDLVTIREDESKNLLLKNGFNVQKVKSFACPAFLFESTKDININKIFEDENIPIIKNSTIGFILSGWNMKSGPYSKWPREENEYQEFVKIVEYITNDLNLNIVLISHNNAFNPKPNFKLKPGRDFLIVNQLYNIIKKRKGLNKNKVFLVKKAYLPKIMHSIIKEFDMIISGRVHGAVSAFSNFIPTIMLDYGHEPKAHKVTGYAKLVGMEELIADPSDFYDMKNKIEKCWFNKEKYREKLKKRIPFVQNLAKENFEMLKQFKRG